MRIRPELNEDERKALRDSALKIRQCAADLGY
jgi:hypothetical protein